MRKKLNKLNDAAFRFSKRAIGSEATLFLFKLKDMAKFAFVGTPRYGIGSVDITYRCNLACKHCYFNEQGYETELTDKQWIRKFESLKNSDFPFYQCSWIGGEPLLRKELIGQLKRYFKTNLVATNGTIPLPSWPDVNFYVSVDGTQKYYKLMRGREHIYPIIKKNASRPELRIILSMTVSKLNYQCIEDLIEEWSVTKVKGIMFQFYTPIRGIEEDLWPGWKIRDGVIDSLIALKSKYGNFIINPVRDLQLMKSQNCQKVTRNCLYAKQSFTLGPDGKLKKPCMMGEKADCSRCGCVLPFHLWNLHHTNLFLREILLEIRKLGSKRWREAMKTYQ